MTYLLDLLIRLKLEPVVVVVVGLLVEGCLVGLLDGFLVVAEPEGFAFGVLEGFLVVVVDLVGGLVALVGALVGLVGGLVLFVIVFGLFVVVFLVTVLLLKGTFRKQEQLMYAIGFEKSYE